MYNDYKKAPYYRKTGPALLVVIILALLILTGCVSQKKYDMALDEIASLKVDSLIQEYEYANNDYKSQAVIYKQKKAIKNQNELIDSLKEVVSLQQDRMLEASSLLRDFDSPDWSFDNIDGKLFIDLSNEVLFESGSSELSDKGLQLTAKVAEVINETEQTNIWVVGHTDNEPFISSSIDNWELSAQRAISVTKALIQNDVSPELITASAKSKYSPKAPNDSEIGKKLNRRTEIILEPSEAIEAEFYNLLNL